MWRMLWIRKQAEITRLRRNHKSTNKASPIEISFISLKKWPTLYVNPYVNRKIIYFSEILHSVVNFMACSWNGRMRTILPFRLPDRNSFWHFLVELRDIFPSCVVSSLFPCHVRFLLALHSYHILSWWYHNTGLAPLWYLWGADSTFSISVHFCIHTRYIVFIISSQYIFRYLHPFRSM
jgi:hypothetical protein